MRFSMPGMPIRTIPALAFVEDRSHLFKAIHLQTVRFIDKDERCRVWNGLLSRLILFEGLEICRVDWRSIAWRASLTIEDIQLREGRQVIIDLRCKGGRIRTAAVLIGVKQGVDAWVAAANIDKGRLLGPLSESGK
jgi:hypothetical protein